MRGLGSLIGTALGTIMAIGGTIMAIGAPISYIYFLYTSAKLGEWLWFVIGLFMPPLGVIGGGLAWAGLIFQPSPEAQARTMQPQVFGTVVALRSFVQASERCSWPEFSAQDRKVARAVIEVMKELLTTQFSTTLAQIAVAEGAAKGAADALDCAGQERVGFQKLIREIKARYGAHYDRL